MTTKSDGEMQGLMVVDLPYVIYMSWVESRNCSGRNGANNNNEEVWTNNKMKRAMQWRPHGISSRLTDNRAVVTDSPCGHLHTFDAVFTYRLYCRRKKSGFRCRSTESSDK